MQKKGSREKKYKSNLLFNVKKMLTANVDKI